MKVLMINKFLHPNGGAETYIFKLGSYLIDQGNEVQYFGMEHAERCVGNHVNAYTKNMNFHGGLGISKLVYPIKTIYSREARIKIRRVLDDFRPDVCHLNNFNYQLTPSIILEIVKWREVNKKECKIVYTAHDYQLVCPNHMLNNPNTHKNCELCLKGSYINCIRGKCIHGSTIKSAIGMMEALFWKRKRVYDYIDTIICCSEFMKKKLDANPLLASKITVLHNFVDKTKNELFAKKDYVLYFGRLAEEKGIRTLTKVCRRLPQINFVFAGAGALENYVEEQKNIKKVGFLSGESLRKIIGEAKFSIYPSEWYEPFGLSVVESQVMGTPVIGARIGGISELIRDGVDGRLFESGNEAQLESLIRELWECPEIINKYSEECKKRERDDIEHYVVKLLKIYRGCEDELIG